MKPKGDRFSRLMEKRHSLKEAEESGRVADSLEVRKGLMARVESKEITLGEAQVELRRIKRGAGQRGLITRAQAYTGRRRR